MHRERTNSYKVQQKSRKSAVNTLHVRWIPCYYMTLRRILVGKYEHITFMFIPCILNNKCLLYTNICTNK